MMLLADFGVGATVTATYTIMRAQFAPRARRSV